MSVDVGTVAVATGGSFITSKFRAQAGMFLSTYNTSDLSAVLDTASMSIGFATSGLAQEDVAIGSSFQTFVPFNDSGSGHTSAIAAFMRTNSQAPGSSVALTDWARCAATVAANTPHDGKLIRYVLFGGTGLQAHIGSFTRPADGSGATITGFPWDPTIVPTCLLGTLKRNGTNDDANLAFFACDDSLSQWSGSFFAPYLARGGQGGMDYAAISAGSAVTAWTSDGFTLGTGPNFGIAYDNYFLALADPDGVFTAGSQTWANHTVAGTPDGWIVGDFWNDPSSGNTGADASLGAFTASGSVSVSVRNRYDDGSEGDAARYRYCVSSEGGVALAVYDPDAVETGSITGTIGGSVGLTASGSPSPTPNDFGYLSFTSSTAKRCRPGALPVLGVG